MPPMNLAAFLHNRALSTPDAEALICGGRSMTFAELDRSTDQLGAWLLSQGLEAGDRVAVQWPNAFEVVQVYFAAFKAGLVAVPVNLRLKPAESAWILQDAGARLAFAAPPFAEALAASGVRVISALPDVGVSAEQRQPPEVDPDRAALILYTSGSTGRPKGAVHSHRTLLATADFCVQNHEAMVEHHGIPRFLLMTPLMHASGLYVLLASISAGEPCALLPMFDSGAALDVIEQHRCTLTLALPAMMQFLVEEQIRSPRDVSSLTAIVAGGDSVPVTLQHRVRDILGAVTLEGLAQTETGPTIINPIDTPNPGSLGLVIGDVELRLVDTLGRDVGQSEPGELLVRSPAVCTGYWQNDRATAEAIREGWFHTGDLVSRDEHGYYWFRGRLKEIIIRGGSNISPQEVEEALYAHPAVLEAAVLGMPHDVWGEVVIAVVALREGVSATGEEILGHARRLLADYKVPERVHFMPVLPKGATGKVQRKALKDMLLAARPSAGA
jgi:long-chain acyl-CoA synthetase